MYTFGVKLEEQGNAVLGITVRLVMLSTQGSIQNGDVVLFWSARCVCYGKGQVASHWYHKKLYVVLCR